MVKLFGEDIYILSIAVLVEAVDDGGDEFVGMIAVRMSNGEQATWQRIGLCLWPSVKEDMVPVQGKMWHSFEGVFSLKEWRKDMAMINRRQLKECISQKGLIMNLICAPPVKTSIQSST